MTSRQLTNNLLMIRPVAFKMNEQTAVNNHFQQDIENKTDNQLQNRAVHEFDDFVNVLRTNGVNITIVEDTPDPDTPDSIFPNNWISLHHDGSVALYPMFAENRRAERRQDILDLLTSEGYKIERITDFTAFEQDNKFLEGTGSMILDRDNHIVYAAVSDRTDPDVLKEFCAEYSYKPIVFHANHTVEGERLPIYHTNVMMGLTDQLAIICLDSIDDPYEKEEVVKTLKSTGKEILEITEEQVTSFAGNMLALLNNQGEKLLVMSEAARQCLSQDQIAQIERSYRIVSSPIDTVETLGGGSARCMMAEVFLPKT